MLSGILDDSIDLPIEGRIRLEADLFIPLDEAKKYFLCGEVVVHFVPILAVYK